MFATEFHLLRRCCFPDASRCPGSNRVLGHVQGQTGWTTLYPAWGASVQTTSAGTPPLDVRLTPNDGGPPLVSTYAFLKHRIGLM